MAEIDTFNKFLVSRGPDPGGIVIQNPPRPGEPLSIDDALNLAAWIVAISGEKKRFDAVYEAVCNT
jgi:hypothetical protein